MYAFLASSHCLQMTFFFPYTSVLALQELTDKADCVLPIENQVPSNVDKSVHGLGI